MDANIQERVLILSSHILDSNDTIRATADKFGVSKSTVHIDVSKRLKKIDKKMHEKIKKILEIILMKNILEEERQQKINIY